MAKKNLTKQFSEIDAMGTSDLRVLFKETLGRETSSRNTVSLRSQIKKKLTENAAAEAATATSAKPKRAKRAEGEPKPARAKRAPKGRHVRADPRLPDVGTTLVRDFKDKRYEIVVIEDGFRYDGERYTSLSTIAKLITGISWNGWSFFKLQPVQKAGAAA